MATSKKFSQLPAASSISNNDLAAIAHEDAFAETGYESQKATMIQIGKKLLGDIEYVTDLPGFPSSKQNPFAALLYLRDSILDMLPIDEVSGAVANFETDVVLPLIDVKAEIVATETGSGAKSPSNPYVISGFNGANLSHSDDDTSNPTVYPVSWQTDAGEVMGGYYDFTTGKLVVTHKAKVKLRDLGYWNYSTSANRFYVNNINDVFQKTDWNKHIGLCECYNEGRVGNNQGDDLAFAFYNATIYLRDNNYSDVQTWLNAVGDYYITYQLATPIEYDLSDTANITALVGVNNVWSDTNGDTTVDYKLGIQAYIDKKIAEVQALVL
jgi:hypothetical protein